MTSRELFKGSAGLLVLKLLDEREMYGYELIQELEHRSEGLFQLREGSLYPILHALEARGALEAYWRASVGKKRRKYYRITKKGKNALAERTRAWRKYQSAVLRVLEGEPT